MSRQDKMVSQTPFPAEQTKSTRMSGGAEMLQKNQKKIIDKAV